MANGLLSQALANFESSVGQVPGQGNLSAQATQITQAVQNVQQVVTRFVTKASLIADQASLSPELLAELKTLGQQASTQVEAAATVVNSIRTDVTGLEASAAGQAASMQVQVNRFNAQIGELQVEIQRAQERARNLTTILAIATLGTAFLGPGGGAARALWGQYQGMERHLADMQGQAQRLSAIKAGLSQVANGLGTVAGRVQAVANALSMVVALLANPSTLKIAAFIKVDLETLENAAG